MKSMNFLNKNLIRYVLDFLSPEEKILLGFSNIKFRSILNLRREFLKLFFFVFRNDYKKSFMSKVREQFKLILNNFPAFCNDFLCDFVACYINHCYGINEYIVFTIMGVKSSDLSFFDNLSKKLFFDNPYEKKKFIFKGMSYDDAELERLQYNFNNFPNTCEKKEKPFQTIFIGEYIYEHLNQSLNISKLNKNYIKEINCTYNRHNNNLINEFFYHNPDSIKTLTIKKMKFNFNWYSLNQFHNLNIKAKIIDENLVVKLKNYITKLKEFTGLIHLKCIISTIEKYEEFFELISANLTNIASLRILPDKNITFDCLELLIKNNYFLRKINLNIIKEDEEEDEDYVVVYPSFELNYIQIGPNLTFNILCSKSFLRGVLSILERNLLDNNEKYSSKFCLIGNVKFIIDFCNFMVDHMSIKNFKIFFSKITNLVIINNKEIEDFVVQTSTKENIGKCLLHMANLKTLFIGFSDTLTKYLVYFQFDMLASIKSFKYVYENEYTNANYDVMTVLSQIKNKKIRYLYYDSWGTISEFKALVKPLKHLVKLTIVNFEKDNKKICNISLIEESLLEFIKNSKFLTIINFQHCCPNCGIVREMIRTKFKHLNA